MRFNNIFKCQTLSAAALLAAVLLLSACGSTPKVAETESDQAATKASAEGDTAVGAEAGTGPQFTFDLSGPDENPYLQQQVSVPGPARVLFADAVSAMQAQNWPQALNLLQQLISQYPDFSGPYLNLGIVYRHLNQPDKAEEAFAKAVSVNEMNIDALNQLALLKREQGDFKAAETFYLSALAVWPKHAASHKNLGILYDMYMGEFAKALQHFEIYQFLQPQPDRVIAGWIIDLQRRLN